jgi:hypothetical protein
MAAFIGVAMYVSTTNPARVRSYPFGDDMTCPRTIQDAETGDVFHLVARHYEVEPAAIDETQARVREFRARQYGATVREIIANDTATAFGEEAA